MRTTKIIALIALIFSLTAAISVTALADISAGAGSTAGAVKPSEIRAEDVVRRSIAAYYPISFYSGLRQSTSLSSSDLMELKLEDHGGIGTDGHGNTVFKNFANVSLKLMTENAAMELKSGNAKIISEKDYTYHGSHVGEEWTRDLKTMIGYGVVLISRESKDGERELFEELYIRNHGVSLDNIRLTKDGDYHIVILMTVEEDGRTKKMAVEYVVPVRTSLYVTDAAGELHVKNEGAFYDAVRLDALGRPDLRITVNGVDVADGTVLSEIGKYDIEVHSNGFLSEKFSFRIFSREEEHAYVYLSNVRAQLDTVSYECENNFKVTWSTSYPSAKMTYWKNGNPDETFEYTDGEVITEAGIYVFELNIPLLANEKKTFLVSLAPDDAPANNYNVLHANRFNSFKTKWLEIYDEKSGLYYCYAPEESAKALDKAISLELEEVTDYGRYRLYLGEKFYDAKALSDAVGKNAEKNVKTVYYDPAGDQIEKYFSDGCFDGTVYLNSDFEFVRTSPAETESVTLTNENGEIISLNYFTPISAYGLPSGRYTVREVDRYGNATEYTALIDKTVPKLTLSTDGEERDAYQLATYTARYFEIGGLSDELDPYSLLSVTLKKGDGVSVSYYRPSECAGLLLTEAGQYTLRAYDRNGNSIKMTVNIPKEEKQYSLLEEDGGIRLALTDGAEVTAIYKNGEETEARELYFPATDTDEEYTVLLEKNGSRDVARFTVPAKRAVLPPAEGGENIAEGNAAWGGMSRDAMLVLVLAVALVSLAALSAVLIIIWRRRV